MEFLPRSIFFPPGEVVDEAGDFGGPETLVKLILGTLDQRPIGVENDERLGQGSDPSDRLAATIGRAISLNGNGW